MGAAGTADVRRVSALFIALMSDAVFRTHRAKIDNRENSRRTLSTVRTGRRPAALRNVPEFLKRSAVGAFVFVNRHGVSYFATDKSVLPLSIFFGPSAFGMMSNLKISVGRKTVAQAFGISTIPLM